jgi:hypothetical protein
MKVRLTQPMQLAMTPYLIVAIQIRGTQRTYIAWLSPVIDGYFANHLRTICGQFADRGLDTAGGVCDIRSGS